MKLRKDGSLTPMTDTEEVRFTRHVNWELAPVWRYWGRFQLVINDREIAVRKLRPFPHPPEWVEVFFPVRVMRPILCGESSVVSKWIKQAVAKRCKAKPGALPVPSLLSSGRPALTDFMGEVEGPDGGVREPSVLMIGCTATGVRVGLKDEDCGGWCWREGVTVEEALDAIEKALQAGEGAFRGPKPQRKGKR